MWHAAPKEAGPGGQSAVQKGELEMSKTLCARVLQGVIVAAFLLLAGAGMAGAQETEGQKAADQAVNYGAAHGALAMTTPGDTSMATLDQVEKIMKGGTARVDR